MMGPAEHMDIRRGTHFLPADSSPRTNTGALLLHLKQQPANKTHRQAAGTAPHSSWQREQGDPAVTLEKASPDGCNRPSTATNGTGGGNSWPCFGERQQKNAAGTDTLKLEALEKKKNKILMHIWFCIFGDLSAQSYLRGNTSGKGCARQ